MRWLMLLGYGIALLWLAPHARDARGFPWGHDDKGREAGLWLLSGSILITWIFAKSVTNAAHLGAAFGLVGGLAYAAYDLSIPVAGCTLASIRKRHGVTSLAEFLRRSSGRGATLAFLVVIVIRLFNEIWRNTAGVGTDFGAQGSLSYDLAALLFTGLTLLYSLKGGMRSSLVTDSLQLCLAVFRLCFALGWVLPRTGMTPILTAGELTRRGGVDLLLVALLQCLRYPFHDPVLTDRGFLTARRVTWQAFLCAGWAGFTFIFLVSWVGMYASLQAIPFADDAPRAVTHAFGLAALMVMTVLMLSSAGSTRDSTRSSLAKWGAIDLASLFGRYGKPLGAGRILMIAMAILGHLPLFAGPSILKATTISGTMVMGLAPIFLFHVLPDVPRLSFHLVVASRHGLGEVPPEAADDIGVALRADR